MTYEQIRAALTARMVAFTGIEQSRIDYPNQPTVFTPPAAGLWCRFNVQYATAFMGAEATRQALELDAVNLLAAGLESGVLNPVEGDGAAARLHAALTGIQESTQRLAQSRDEAVDKAAQLQKQVDDLLAQAEKGRQAEAEAKEIADLKAKLDAAGVTYRANASKESLQKQVDELAK